MDLIQYKVIVMPKAHKDMEKIYDYIAEELYAERAALNLMKHINREVDRLQYSPYINPRISKIDELKRQYRRIVVKNYIILYIIEEKERLVIVSHMYYGRRNYLGSDRL